MVFIKAVKPGESSLLPQGTAAEHEGAASAVDGDEPGGCSLLPRGTAAEEHEAAASAVSREVHFLHKEQLQKLKGQHQQSVEKKKVSSCMDLRKSKRKMTEEEEEEEDSSKQP